MLWNTRRLSKNLLATCEKLASLPKLANGHHNAGAEVKLKQSLFNKLPKKTQELYNEKAKSIHEANLQEWSLNITCLALKDPKARQVCMLSSTGYNYLD